MVKLGLILAVYAFAACTVLAVVHNVTAPVIESNNLKKAAAAMKMVFPEADQFETADGFNGSTKSGNTVIGSIILLLLIILNIFLFVPFQRRYL